MTNYIHDKLYVYNALSQTFEPYLGQIEALERGLLDVVAGGFTCFVSFGYYTKHVSVSLSKWASSGSPSFTMEVKAEGKTVGEAFTKAFSNFPERPLDGSTRWASDRIAGPVTDGEFTETS